MKKKLVAALIGLSTLAPAVLAFGGIVGGFNSIAHLQGMTFEADNGSVRGTATYACPYPNESYPPTFADVTLEKRGMDNERPGIMWIAMVTQSGIPAMDEAVRTGKIPRNQNVSQSAKIYFVDQNGNLVEFTGATSPPPAAVDRTVLRQAHIASLPIEGNNDGTLRAIYVGYGLVNEKMLRDFEMRKKGIEKSDKIAAERGLSNNRPAPEIIMESHMYTMIQREMMDNLRMIKVAEMSNQKCYELRQAGYLGGLGG